MAAMMRSPVIRSGFELVRLTMTLDSLWLVISIQLRSLHRRIGIMFVFASHVYADSLVKAPLKINSDHGTETVDLYSVHTSFHQLCPEGNVDESYKYSKSVHNQKIECF